MDPKHERPTAAEQQLMAMTPNTPAAKAIRARLRYFDAATARDELAARIAELEKSVVEPSAADASIYGRLTVGGRTVPLDHPAFESVARVDRYKRASAELQRLRDAHAQHVGTAESAASALPALEAEATAAAAAEEAKHAERQAREAQLQDRFNVAHRK